MKTSENLGSQAEWPSHPELLDWLATEFVRLNWKLKAMQKIIVMSATYRQSSQVTPQLLDHDPDNRLLARGPRFRLSDEAKRDQALAVSGLLLTAGCTARLARYQNDPEAAKKLITQGTTPPDSKFAPAELAALSPSPQTSC